MAAKTIIAFKERFEEIRMTKEPIRTKRLANLMSDMEKTYSIPFLSGEKYNRLNPLVIQLYRDISFARNFEEGASV